MEHWNILVQSLIKFPTETEWIEFKLNNSDPESIGEYISALGNSAAYHNKYSGYILWGIDNASHQIEGTSFDYRTQKVGNEEIENWLRRMLSDNANFNFYETELNNKKVVILIISRAIYKPVMFRNTEYIRIGSYKKKLNDYPAVEVQLWNTLNLYKYEQILAMQDLQKNEALQFLDYSAYFDMLKQTLPNDVDGILHYLIEEKVVQKQDNSLYAITNLGALLFAKKLSAFSNMGRKSVRVVQYKGNDKYNIMRQDEEERGYASAFESIIKYIISLLPANEPINLALRETVSMYPTIAIREAVANALIHQDLSKSGAGPVIEIFSNRLEITNPGTPLVDIKRIIDNPPKSRNELLASMLRRLHVCEELGTGWDKIAKSCELYQLPAPKIEVYQDSTKITLFAHIPFSRMSHEDKIRACYLHASLKQVMNEQMTNSSLRDRFGLESSNASAISRLIKDAVDEGFIKPFEPNTAPKHMKYVPFWA